MDGAAHALKHKQVNLSLGHELNQRLVETGQVEAGARLARVDAFQSTVLETLRQNWKSKIVLTTFFLYKGNANTAESCKHSMI